MPGETEALGQQGEMPDLAQLRLLQTFDINFLDVLFWCALSLFIFEPMHRCLIAYQENIRIALIRSLGIKLTFRIYCVASFSYSVLTFFLFQKAVTIQPRLRDLQRNEALLAGYVFALAGLCIKARIHMTNSVASIMGGQYFGMEVHKKTTFPNISDNYYHPLGTTSVVCYFGLSIIRASAAGILMTIILGISTILASHLERYYLNRSTKMKLQHLASTSIPGSQGDSSIKED